MTDFLAENKLFILSTLFLAALVAGATELQRTYSSDTQASSASQASTTASAVSPVSMSPLIMTVRSQAPTTTTTIVAPLPPTPPPQIKSDDESGDE